MMDPQRLVMLMGKCILMLFFILLISVPTSNVAELVDDKIFQLENILYLFNTMFSLLTSELTAFIEI